MVVSYQVFFILNFFIPSFDFSFIMLTWQTCYKTWLGNFSLTSNIIKYNPYGLIAFHVLLFYGWPISGNMTWASLKIYFVPIKYCLLSIVFDEFKNISENLGKSQLKMESPGIIWDSGQVARISGSAINPNLNENKEMS